VAVHLHNAKDLWQTVAMSGSRDLSAATHFGRQVRKERLAHGWTLGEFAARTGIDGAHWSRVENGRRPPTEKLAQAADEAFPERRGWFSDWYAESRTWTEVPAGFRSWSEVEDRATSLRSWTPGIIDGLLQTEDYARALIAVQPAITDEVAVSRLANRIERQRRAMTHERTVSMWFVIDQAALGYRCIGSPEIMAAQMLHLRAVAALPHVTVQVIPAVAHPANASGFVVADDIAWCEHVAGGYVFTGGETVTLLARLFDSLRAESYRASESAALIEKAGALWATGGSPLTPTATAANA
jgi:transcriptional regulator with XRE-family HTH domain